MRAFGCAVMVRVPMRLSRILFEVISTRGTYSMLVPMNSVYLKFSDTLRDMYVSYLSLDLIFTSLFCYLFVVSLVMSCFCCSVIAAYPYGILLLHCVICLL